MEYLKRWLLEVFGNLPQTTTKEQAMGEMKRKAELRGIVQKALHQHAELQVTLETIALETGLVVDTGNDLTAQLVAEATPVPDPVVLKFGVVVGHTQSSQGAVVRCHKMAYANMLRREVNNKYTYTEYTFNKEVAQRLAQHRSQFYSQAGVVYEVEVVVAYRDRIGLRGAYKLLREAGVFATMELHFNSFDNPQAHGATVLSNTIEEHSAERVLSTMLIDMLNAKFDFRKRALRLVDPNKHAGGTAVTTLAAIPQVLVEPFFGSSPDDVMKLIDNGGVDAIAATYNAAIHEFAQWHVAQNKGLFA